MEKQSRPTWVELVEEARGLPGVAEAMEVYGRSEEVMSRARPYLKVLERRVVHTTSSTTA
jgi:hypothetical protein